MKAVLAQPRGVCAGVDRALRVVELALERFGPPIYVRREIVHNRYVVDGFRKRGVRSVEELVEIPDGSLVIFSAHGVSPKVYREAQQRGLRTIDATCPLVAKVHSEVERYSKRGYRFLLIGHQGHDEVIGTIGYAPDKMDLVSNVTEANEIEVPPNSKLMILTQTTLFVDEAVNILEVLRHRFPFLETPPAHDICYATQNRQNAVKKIANHADLVLIVGSQNSSNAIRLVEVAKASGVVGRLVESDQEVDSKWLVGVKAVGVSASASTPEVLVEKVMARLREFGFCEVETMKSAEENIVFGLPVELAAELENSK
ncbi:MAG: 4-hydroxy-3-methylbut-2-enyl diphosphate reductase [Pseudomonadota bacterium]